jgi:dihydropteroate synthase
MGICNVTPDSFSDGGRFADPEAARRRVDRLVAEGADIVDVGGESTRPSGLPVPASEQLARVLDVVRYAAERTCVSIDTADPVVAEACLRAGASVVNDVSCLRDPRLAEVVARHDAALLLMHARRTPTNVRGFGGPPAEAYGDVVLDVVREWQAARDCAVSLGVSSNAIVMDPGFGFGKAAEQSRELLARLGEVIARCGVPVCVGASRKSFLGAFDPAAPADERLGASIAAALVGARAGAELFRVHDVRATAQALDAYAALSGDALGSFARAKTRLASQDAGARHGFGSAPPRVTASGGADA